MRDEQDFLSVYEIKVFTSIYFKPMCWSFRFVWF